MTRHDAFSNCTRNARAGKRVNRKLPSSPVIASYSPIRAKVGHTSYASSVLTGMALCDPEEWLPEFAAWSLRECVWFDRAFGGLGALHAAFGEWCVRNRSVPCTRYVFEQLLNAQGFRICDALVSALVLRKDLEVMTHD
jgi:hypothetical protein